MKLLNTKLSPTHPDACDVEHQEVHVLRVSLEDLFIKVAKDRHHRCLLVELIRVGVVAQLTIAVVEHLFHANIERLGHWQFHLITVDFIRLVGREIVVELFRMLYLLARDVYVQVQKILQDQIQDVVDHARTVIEHLEEIVHVADDLEVGVLEVGELESDLLAHCHRDHWYHIDQLLYERMNEIQLKAKLLRRVSVDPKLAFVI